MRGVLLVAVDVSAQVDARRALEETTARLAASERRYRQAALTLQHSLLPAARPSADDLEVAVRYVAGADNTDVGGDWYDVINLGAGRVAVVVGDVMGRGLRAAAVMGQLRAAVRGYARLDLPPSEVLELLDGLVEDLAEAESGQIVTCVYAVYDPGTGRLSYASAGHLPPVLVGPGRSAVMLRQPVAPPLGSGSAPVEEYLVAMPPGSMLALYTDGLVEDRGRDVDTGVEALRDLLRADADPQVLADEILARLGRAEGHDDDVVLLLLRVPADPSEVPRRTTLSLPPIPQTVGHARRHTRRVLARWGVADELADVAVLLVDELVTNAIRHGQPPRTMQVRRSRRRLVVEVSDGSGQLPRRRRAGDDDENGRGLHLVAGLSARWGARPTVNGKTVWAEFVLGTGPDRRPG